jgi:probable rRNA maturation factor
MMKNSDISLSLQFGRDDEARAHRGVLTRSFVRRCLKAALSAPAEMTVRVVGAAEGQALNREYRARDYATNVLTFDYAREPVVCADLVLCAPVVAAEAAAQRIALADHYAHLLVHGALHAQGHDHEEDAQAQVMEALETQILAGLGVRDPYAVLP